jgi:hypothetical protein
MIKLKLPDYKKLAAKCLLIIYLFFNFIAIAGNGLYTNSTFQKSEQATLFYSTESNSTTNKIVSYRKCLRPAKKIFTHSLKYSLFNLLVHNRLVKAAFNSFSKKINSIPAPVRFVQIKTIPKSSGEVSFTSFTS